MRKIVLAAALFALLPVKGDAQASWLDNINDDSYVIRAVLVVPQGELNLIYQGHIFGEKSACDAVLAGTGDDPGWQDANIQLREYAERVHAKSGVTYSCITAVEARKYVKEPKKEDGSI